MKAKSRIVILYLIVSCLISCKKSTLSETHKRYFDSLGVDYKALNLSKNKKVLIDKICILTDESGNISSIQTAKSKDSIYLNNFNLEGELESEGWRIKGAFSGHTYFYDDKGDYDSYVFYDDKGEIRSFIEYNNQGKLSKKGVINLVRSCDAVLLDSKQGCNLKLNNIKPKKCKITTEITERDIITKEIINSEVLTGSDIEFHITNTENIIELRLVLINNKDRDDKLTEFWVFSIDGPSELFP
ncbi:MAG: hypothetical protein JXQ87_09230 [Bacteroidia bacterium]